MALVHTTHAPAVWLAYWHEWQFELHSHGFVVVSSTPPVQRPATTKLSGTNGSGTYTLPVSASGSVPSLRPGVVVSAVVSVAVVDESGAAVVGVNGSGLPRRCRLLVTCEHSDGS